jgi:DNA topoisomerase-3
MEFPPATFDTTDLQRTANRLFRWSAKKTSRLAQNLYAKFGAITYPRTDCAKIPVSMREDVMSRWHFFYSDWLPANYPQCMDRLPKWSPDEENNFAETVSDHHAIIPTGVIPPINDPRTGVPFDEYILWDLIVRRFLTSWLPPATIFASSRAFTVPYQAGEHLRALVKAAPVVEANWLIFEDVVGTTRGFERRLADRTKDKMLPEMAETALMKNIRPMILETHPPDLFTYDKLLHAMDAANLGTSATRAEILAGLISSGLIVEDSHGRVVITEEGERIVALLRAHGGEQVLDTKLTAFWEKQLDLVGKSGINKRTREDFLTDIMAQIRDLGLRLIAPTLVEDIVFCPKTGLRVEPTEKGWRFGGWPDTECPRIILSRDMRAQEYRDIFSSGRKGAGPYEGFVSRKSGNPFKAWMYYDKKEKAFKFMFKQRRGSAL